MFYSVFLVINIVLQFNNEQLQVIKYVKVLHISWFDLNNINMNQKSTDIQQNCQSVILHPNGDS